MPHVVRLWVAIYLWGRSLIRLDVRRKGQYLKGVVLIESFDVGIIGSGYVGLVTGACLSHLGHRVRCIDKDEERARELTSARIPFYEPGLENLVSRGVGSGRLSFAGPEGLRRLAQEAEVIFIAVDTPQGEEGSTDLSSVAAVAR